MARRSAFTEEEERQLFEQQEAEADRNNDATFGQDRGPPMEPPIRWPEEPPRFRSNSNPPPGIGTSNSGHPRPILRNRDRDWYGQWVQDLEPGRYSSGRYPFKEIPEKHVHFEDGVGRDGSGIEEIIERLKWMNRREWMIQAQGMCDIAAQYRTNSQSAFSPFFGDSIWSCNPRDSVYNFLSRFMPHDVPTQIKTDMEKARNEAKPAYTWSGQLPRKPRNKNPTFSCKVFLGGIPYDLTDSDLHCTFAKFGHIQIQWPGRDIKSAIDGAAANRAGYVYIIFESYDNVTALLNNCTISYRDLDSGCRWYYSISSRRQKGKEVQVIPFDIGDRFYMKNSFVGQMDHSRTVFVGALHGMLSADGLAKVMDDLFGGVIYAGLDTDKYKYPLGSGRVSFDNQESYNKAISAAFVEVKSARFRKKIQIDPYIESEMSCSKCGVQQTSPIFCRNDFVYFCTKCWEEHRMNPESAKHRPIIKNKSVNA